MTQNRTRTLIFIVVVAAAALAARFWYAGISGIPGIAAHGGASPAGTPPAAPSSSAPALVSADPASLSSGNAQAPSGSAPYYGEPSTAGSRFTRIATTSIPDFSHEAFLVRDLAGGVDMADDAENVRWPTASLTKLMTATLVMDHLGMDTRITITPQMAAVDPTQQELATDGTYTVYDLLHALLMPSNNVAAEALADYYGHTQFMAEMNARAAAWGMSNTHFNDPSGLSSANESSAHDLAILATHVYEDYPKILSFSNTPSIAIANLADDTTETIRSINDFAGDPDFVGGKTGYIPEAGDNLLSIFNVNGKPVIIVVLGAANTAQRFSDTTKLLDWFTMNYK